MPANASGFSYKALLQHLSAAGVRCIVIGGAAAVLHGSSMLTKDLDIVPDRSAENLDRLEAVLRELGALIRDPARRRIEPPRWALEGERPVLMQTSLGPLDALGTLNDGRGYEDLVDRSLPIPGYPGIRFLDLPTLIEVKLAAGRPKDLQGVAILKALEDELSGGDED
jgi:hypothetical protein